MLLFIVINYINLFCFWWWNRNEKQKYNTDINICTNKSGPFIHETEHARYMQSSRVSVRKNWLLVQFLTGSWLKTGTWRFFWLLLFGSQSSPIVIQSWSMIIISSWLTHRNIPIICHGNSNSVVISISIFFHFKLSN